MTPTTEAKTLLLLKPRGFCAGVVRAIDIVRIALETFGPPIYVRKEIVHNKYVVEDLKGKGAIFVDDVEEVPNGERVIYSAHGVAPSVHDEIVGTLGEAPEVTQVVSNADQVKNIEVTDPNRVAYLTQTTLSLDEAKDIIDALKAKFPNIRGPQAQDICYATENRQVAVKNVAEQAELVLVVGSPNSSNSNRLVEVAGNLGTNSFLIDTCRDIDERWLEGVKTVALTAGASAPEILVQEVMEFLGKKGFSNVREVEVMPEHVRFALPPEIVAAIGAAPEAPAAE